MWRFLNKLIANFHLSISSVFEYIKLFSQYIKLFIHVRHIIKMLKKDPHIFLCIFFLKMTPPPPPISLMHTNIIQKVIHANIR